MYNENKKEKSILDQLFECREENLCAITKYDREKINDLIKDNDNYQKLMNFLDETINDNNAKDKVKNSLESYIDAINIVGAYENEKFYKIRIY